MVLKSKFDFILTFPSKSNFRLLAPTELFKLSHSLGRSKINRQLLALLFEFATLGHSDDEGSVL